MSQRSSQISLLNIFRTCNQTASTVNRSLSNGVPLGCGGTDMQPINCCSCRTKFPRTVSSVLLNLCHEELWQFCSQRGRTWYRQGTCSSLAHQTCDKIFQQSVFLHHVNYSLHLHQHNIYVYCIMLGNVKYKKLLKGCLQLVWVILCTFCRRIYHKESFKNFGRHFHVCLSADETHQSKFLNLYTDIMTANMSMAPVHRLQVATDGSLALPTFFQSPLSLSFYFLFLSLH